MYFSSKITISVVSYLADKGVTVDSLFEHSDLVFVKESNYWLDANKVEAFLAALEQKFGSDMEPNGLVTEAAHCSHQLRSWGVLDSVLRMMPDPSDIYAQPQRFISYFISPPPPIGNFQTSGQTVSFELPISKEEFPVTTSYIAATLEGLPQYTGGEKAYVSWNENKLHISWAKIDIKTAAKSQQKTQMSQLLLKVSDAEKRLELKSEELLGKRCEITELKHELTEIQGQKKGGGDESTGEEWIDFAHRALQKSLMQVQGKMLQLNDYLIRSQQLVTLLVGQDRMSRQVQEAMRRVDWEQIQSRSSSVLEEGLGSIFHMQSSLRELKSLDLELSSPQENKVFMDLNQMLTRVIKRAESQTTDTIELQTAMDLDQQVEVFPESMEKALFQVLKGLSTQKKSGPVQLRLQTRLKKGRAEIEFIGGHSEFHALTPKRKRYLGVASSIVKMHNGTLNCSKIESGSSCKIELPTGNYLSRELNGSEIHVEH